MMANTMHLLAARPRAYTFDGLGDGPEQLALGLAAGDVLGNERCDYAPQRRTHARPFRAMTCSTPWRRALPVDFCAVISAAPTNPDGAP
jgi:hypothetical protein